MNLKELRQQQYKGLFTKRTASTQGAIKSFGTVEGKEGVKHVITVQFSDYTIVDDSDDLMLRGAFNGSFENHESSNRKIAFLWQHDHKDPIGRIVKFWEDDLGAYVEVELSDFESVPNAKRAWAQIQDGTLNQASFGFRYDWEACKWVEVKDEQGRIKDSYFAVGNVFLHEVSLVTLGANENTQVVDAQEAEKSFIKHFLRGEKVKAALIGLNDTEVDDYMRSLGIEVTRKSTSLFGRQ